MGNCQAAEAATVVIQHPPEENGKGRGRVERVYNSRSANEVMGSNPGYYVALVLESPATARNHLKLLKPDEILLIGHVYRLISFQDVLKEFAAKKSVKLGKLLKESGVIAQIEAGGHRQSSSSMSSSRVVGRGPWKPALQSIAESATS